MFLKRMLFTVSLLATIATAAVSDFTVTDLDGNEHNLYTYLNEGKHVLVEFMMFD